MTTTLIRERATVIHSTGFIYKAKDSEIPGLEGALDRFISGLLCAFFIAMAVTWIVTTITGIFS
jgi:hypothetical protein